MCMMTLYDYTGSAPISLHNILRWLLTSTGIKYYPEKRRKTNAKVLCQYSVFFQIENLSWEIPGG